ncbi:PTS sugar transporter subunit IIC [Oceanobacillus oncorhynchi]|uniref:PTS sugar transporter subunit IIC n=1 Tax=Oceanobacillus oncorhynchi TaxID=545501 RepID=UPI0025A49E14|nr:PTS transporter subunit EIIC [Oceanobacillus oncorhynchi]MDM8101224.1 PTS transporter subunit EIIC [Oceanobacillus oncorhynchi]
MMEKIMNFMSNKFAPRVNRIVANPWVSAIQSSMLTGLPLVFVGSLITIISILNNFFEWMPDLSLMSTFSFGMFGLIIAFFIPYFVMENKGHSNNKLVSGATSLVLYLLLLFPEIHDGQITFSLSRFGIEGMLVALVTGLFVAVIMNFMASKSFFDEDSAIPDFVVSWFDNLLPITVILFVGWLATIQFGIDLFQVIQASFQPIAGIVSTYPGFVLSVFIPVFLYSFGISAWAVFPVFYPMYMANLAGNMDAVASGEVATNIATQETLYALISIGGVGTTLALAIMMAFISKSQQLKAIGKAVIVPSVFNINEPVVFGAPIAFNPYLMVPMWINGLLVPTIVYGIMAWGWVAVPSSTFLLWYMPYPIASYFATQDVMAIFWCIVILIITWAVYYPFFKVYDNSLLVKEKEENNQ